MRAHLTLLITLLIGSMAAPRALGAEALRLDEDVTQGALRIQRPGGEVVECPLLHTVVQADIAGFIARVRVKQTFHNPTSEKIEAVYVFPLPHESAVDDMTMVIGERRIVGVIQKRADARSIYERALAAGQTAALLEQERPNIFTQSVGNIEPDQKIDIEISYVDVLAYDMGSYEFRFPMVVGPRYVPGNPLGSPPQPNAELEGKVAPMTPDTDRVPDASRINPPVLKPGERTGHDISLAVNLNAGVPIQGLASTNHIIDQQKQGDARYTLAIHNSDTLPNKDFVLRYKVMGEKPEIAMLAHAPGKPGGLDAPGGYFMLMVQPKEDERLNQQPPREIVFLVDISGSMSGAPTEKVKQAMSGMLKLCRADRDTMQLITFAGSTSKLFEQAVPVNEANTRKALAFTDGFSGSGGTNMLEGVKAAIDAPLDPERVRIVIMLTDGYIGNESEIIEHVGRNCGDRVRFWTIGVGSSVNMMLIDGVAKQGGGMGKVLGINDDAVPLTQEIMTRIQRAQLANVKIDWGGLNVTETYPARIPELWSGRPIVLLGRYTGSGPAVLTIHGNLEGQPAQFTVNTHLPAHAPSNDQLAKVWARRKIEDLMQQTFYAGSPAVEEMITQIALEHRLMSQYTSFVAVDEKEASQLRPGATPPRRMLVPVPLPAGTRYEGFFGTEGDMDGDQDILAIHKGDGPVAALQFARQAASPVNMKMAEPLAPAQAPRVMAGGVSAGGGGRHGSGVVREERLRPSNASFARASYERARSARPLRSSRGVREAAAQDLAQAQQVDAADEVNPDWVSANAAVENGDLAAAREAYLRVYFADLAGHYRNGRPWEEPQYAQAAEEALEQVHRKQVEAWSRVLPGLSTRLDLVIRDQSVEAALRKACTSAGVHYEVLAGSLSDSAMLLGVDEVRVSFLDLRHATVAEALDWICLPNRLSWWVEEGTIRIASERRRAGERVWIYDVGVLAWPTDAELAPAGPQPQDQQNQDEIQAKHTEALEQFVTAMRTHLGREAKAVEWFGDGMLLVIGSPQGHERAAAALAQLADSKATPAEAFASLHAHTARRAAERKDALAQEKRDAELYAVAARLNAFSWPLLAAAANGEVDLEALTELQIAWQSPRVKELVDGEGKLIAMRSMWAINQSALALAGEKEVQELWQRARPHWLPVWTAAANGEDAKAQQTLLYAQLVREQVSQPPAARELPPDLRLIVDVLLGGGDGQALAAMLADSNQQPRGEDQVVLTALAARKAGGAAWETFRSRQAELLGQQPLPGSVVVLVNRLASPRLPIVAHAK